jgi:hypothetical protein
MVLFSPIRSDPRGRKWRKAGEPVAHDTTQPFLLEERPFSSLSAHLIIFFFFYKICKKRTRQAQFNL